MRACVRECQTICCARRKPWLRVFGQGFDSPHFHHVAASSISLAATFLQKSPSRSFRCVSFSEKGHATPLLLACKRARNAPACYQPFSGIESSNPTAEMPKISFSCGFASGQCPHPSSQLILVGCELFIPKIKIHFVRLRHKTPDFRGLYLFHDITRDIHDKFSGFFRCGKLP